MRPYQQPKNGWMSRYMKDDLLSFYSHGSDDGSSSCGYSMEEEMKDLRRDVQSCLPGSEGIRVTDQVIHTLSNALVGDLDLRGITEAEQIEIAIVLSLQHAQETKYQEVPRDVAVEETCLVSSTTTLPESLKNNRDSFSVSSLEWVSNHGDDVICVDEITTTSRVTTAGLGIGNDWEMLSEIESVVSMASSGAPFSYRDALKIGAAPRAKECNTGVTRVAKPPESSLGPIGETSEDDGGEDSEFDAFFVMEGIKGGRGGRSQDMFRGNAKVAKRPRKRVGPKGI